MTYARPRPHSIRARLWLAASGSIALALLIAGLGLVALFERHVERRIGAELSARLNQLAASVELGSDATPSLARLPLDPRFDQPFSGLYWQIDLPDQPGVLRSRSLWDEVLDLPADVLDPGTLHAHVLDGPRGQRLLVRERRVLLDRAGKQHALRLAVAQDRQELLAARKAFADDMRPYLGVIALVLLLATLVQIHLGLAPLESLRRGVESIRTGRSRQLGAGYPEEVMPLVSEVDALLQARAQALERARAWTADLAHGLKTPLSALASDAERLRQAGHTVLAQDLEQLAEFMRRRVDRELVRARLRSGATVAAAQVDVVAELHRLLHTLQRTPQGEALEWHAQTPTQAIAALMPDDLLELLGNLLENAAKWAHSHVSIQLEAGESIRITLSDDGPGVPADQLDRLGERGLRLDRTRDGTGLGLAIVRDVVDAYGGRLHFGSAAAGGLEVWVQLPAADARALSMHH